MTFAEFVVNTMALKAACPDLRLGQCYMSTLYDVRKDIYDEIMDLEGSEIWNVDPFYNDKKINKFLEYVAKRWDT